MRHGREALTALAVVSILSACSGGGSDSPGNGTLSVSLMDRPVDGVTEVNVTVSDIWVKPQGEGEKIRLDLMADSITVNLLDLDDINPAVLVNEVAIPAGIYNWIEMQIEDADISFASVTTESGGEEPLDVDVPSGRLRLVSGFEVAENQGVRILFDWDVRKGLTEAVGRGTYLLRPAFRILDADEIGVLSGTVDVSSLCPGITDADQPVVYVFSGTVEPAAADPANAETTADVELDSASNYAYRAVVMPGTYTLALTCQGQLEDSAIVLEEFQSAEVFADMATEPVNFPAE